jgi:hypothetical protein
MVAKRPDHMTGAKSISKAKYICDQTVVCLTSAITSICICVVYPLLDISTFDEAD